MYNRDMAIDEIQTIIAKSKNRKEAVQKIAEWAEISQDHPLIISVMRSYSQIKKDNAWRDSPLMKALS